MCSLEGDEVRSHDPASVACTADLRWILQAAVEVSCHCGVMADGWQWLQRSQGRLCDNFSARKELCCKIIMDLWVYHSLSWILYIFIYNFGIWMILSRDIYLYLVGIWFTVIGDRWFGWISTSLVGRSYVVWCCMFLFGMILDVIFRLSPGPPNRFWTNQIIGFGQIIPFTGHELPNLAFDGFMISVARWSLESLGETDWLFPTVPHESPYDPSKLLSM